MKSGVSRTAWLVLGASFGPACSIVGGFTDDRVLLEETNATGSGATTGTSSGSSVGSTTASTSSVGGQGGAGGEASTSTSTAGGAGGRGSGGEGGAGAGGTGGTGGGTGGLGPLGEWPDSATRHCQAPDAAGAGGAGSGGGLVCDEEYCAVPCDDLPAGFTSQDGAVVRVEPLYDSQAITAFDAVTGLSWTRDVVEGCGAGGGGAGADTVEAAVDCCDELVLDDASDWRLPRFHELVSLWDAGVAGAPAFDPEVFFGPADLANSRYWSSDLTEDGRAVLVGFRPIDVHFRRVGDEDPALVRCVRGLVHEPEPLDEEGVVVDRTTGLMWPDEQPPSCVTWADALAACEGLETGRHGDWRPATVKELATIVDPAAPTNVSAGFALPGSCARRWSSTPRTGLPGRIFTLQMSDTPTALAGEMSASLAKNAVASPVCVRTASD